MQRAMTAVKADTTLPVSLLSHFDLTTESFWNELLGGSVGPFRQQVLHHNMEGGVSSDPLIKFCNDIGVVVSPHIKLRRRDTDGDVCWAATCDIPVGTHLLGVPCYAALDSSIAGDPLANYFTVLEHLASQLVLRQQLPLWEPYITSLKSVPNMPFLAPTRLLTDDAKAILARCHDLMEHPLSDVLRGVSPETHKWALSVALSRRSDAFLLPMADFLNHSPLPNSHATMPNVHDVSVADAMDNYLAGCEDDALTEAYYHLYSIRPIPSGTDILTSYSDVDPTSSEGRDAWRSVWGFVPHKKADMTHKQLTQFTSSLARCRSARLSK